MDVASYDEAGALALEAAVQMAGALPGDGWLQRIAEGAPFGPIEALLAAVRGTVYARATAQDAGYGLETELAEPDRPWSRPRRRRSRRWSCCSARWSRSASGSRRCSRTRPTGSTRRRARGSRARSAASPGARRRSRPGSRCAARIGGPADPDFVDWLAVERVEGREYDVGLHRHWLDPTRPLAEAVLKPAHGVLVTSATLRGGEDWASAEARTGALPSRPRRRRASRRRARSIMPRTARC